MAKGGIDGPSTMSISSFLRKLHTDFYSDFTSQKNMLEEKKTHSTNGTGQTWCRRMKLDFYFIPCIKHSSKWIKDISMRPEIVILIEEKVRNILELIVTRTDFLNCTQKAQAIRPTINKQELMKLVPVQWDIIFQERGSLHNVIKSSPAIHLTEGKYLEYTMS